MFSELTSDTGAVANALGACIVDSPELQSRLISLFMPVESQRHTDFSTGVEAVTLEAILNLCHQDKVQVLVSEIATEVNRLQKDHGERVTYSAKKIGHLLKKLDLYTRRLGKASRGLFMDSATRTRIHKVAAVYSCVGLVVEEINLHCQLCIEHKRLMQVM